MDYLFLLLIICLVLLAACIILFIFYRTEYRERRKLHFIIAHQREQIEDFKTIADNCQEIVQLERKKMVAILDRVLTEREREGVAEDVENYGYSPSSTVRCRDAVSE